LTQEVLVTGIQTTLHETTTLCAYPAQCGKALKVHLLLSSTKVGQKFRRRQSLRLPCPI
jgi:hypothetical protein